MFFFSSDFYTVGGVNPTGAVVSGFTPIQISLNFTDTSQTAFTSDALPVIPPDTGLFAVTSMTLQFEILGGGLIAEVIATDITNVTSMPLPAGVWLLSAALTGLAFMSRKDIGSTIH